MLHRAYAELAVRGMRYSATHQAPDITARRLFKGHPLLAEVDGRIVGTLTVYPPQPNSIVAAYRDPRTCSFGQFGVEPDYRGKGIGRALHQAAVAHARSQGARYLSLDTAVPAKELIATYERWGYVIVERTHWNDTNYESVIMRLRIAPDGKESRSNVVERVST